MSKAPERSDGWDASASAWIADIGANGGYGRQFVLDPVMTGRIDGRGYSRALDVGCGEGRFCRMMATHGIAATGIDPTKALLDEAKRRDPKGDYRAGRAEELDFSDGAFDLVVSYLTLIDIPDLVSAVGEMARVLKPGGTLLIANLNGFLTARADVGWVRDATGRPSHMIVDDYLDERVVWVAWRGIRIQNWHRPLSTYMKLFLGQGLELVHFDEPPPLGGPAGQAERQRRVPYFVVMEWRKPATWRVTLKPPARP